MGTDLERDYLEAIFHRSPDAIVVVDEDGRIVHANRRVTELLGYDRTEVEGELIELLVPEADRADHPEMRDAYMTDPKTRPMGANLELRARRKDGSTFPVDIGLSPIDAGDRPEVMAVIRDRTDQEALRQKYRTVFEVAPDAMIISDTDSGRVLEVNQQAATLFETSTENLVGRYQWELHPADERERCRSLFDRAIEAPETLRTATREAGDLHAVTDDGDRVPIEVTARVVDMVDRRVIICAYRDVSAQREHERKLHRQIDRLERFAHLLSHDLRNPLSVATGYVEQTQETGEIEYLEQVEAEHVRIREIIDDVLTMVRHGYDVESVEPLEFESVVSECWQHVATADATLEIESEGLLYADSDRVRNLFENLFRNSVEHGGQPLTVRVGLLEDGFFVEDDGPGIPESERDTVFEPGWTTATEGTGLGLNIVYEIANAHGWDVTIEDGRDGGARFVFSAARTAVADESFTAEDRP